MKAASQTSVEENNTLVFKYRMFFISMAHFYAFGLFKRCMVISVQILYLQLMKMSGLLLEKHCSQTLQTHHNLDGKSVELEEGTILWSSHPYPNQLHLQM